MKIVDINMTLTHISRKILTISLILCSLTVVADNFEISLSTGKGFYKLQDMKSFQELSIPDYGVDIRMVESFPSYYFYSVSACYYIHGNWGVGFEGSFFSTGARNHYEDYSGYYKLDLILKSQNAGLLVNHRFRFFNRFFVIPEVNGGIKFSSLDISENLKVYNDSLVSSMQFNNYSFFAKPRLRLAFNPVSHLCVGMSGGYEFNFPRELFFKDNKNMILINSHSQKVLLDWSGFQLALSLSFTF
jgi:hypothetical protein